MSNPTQLTRLTIPTDQASDSLNSVFLEMGLEMNYDSDHKVCLEIGPDLSGTVVKLDG